MAKKKRPAKASGTPPEPNFTNYSREGQVNGKAVHVWTCNGADGMSCGWHATRIGGQQAINSGAAEAQRHQCYDSSKDSWSDRKDLQ
jgi:hypothetical protein